MLRGQPRMPLRRQTTTCLFDPGQEPGATTAAQGAAIFELARGRFAGGRDDIFSTGPSPLPFYQHHHHHNDDRPAACDDWLYTTCRQPGRRPPSPRSHPEAGRRPPARPPCRLQPRYRRVRAPHGRSRLDALVRPLGHGCRAGRRWLHVGAQPAPDAPPKPLGGISSCHPPTRTRARRRRPLGA